MSDREDIDLPPASDDPDVQGLCACGCKGITPVARRSRPYLGHVKGQHVRFIPGHVGRTQAHIQGRRWFFLEKALRGITIDDNGCWIWPTVGLRGYGTFGKQGAHTVVYELIVGGVPEGLELDHVCRVTACVNPDHLEPVTHAENVRRGASAKLTAVDAKAIRESPMTCRALAALYRVSPSLISAVKNEEVWA